MVSARADSHSNRGLRITSEVGVGVQTVIKLADEEKLSKEQCSYHAATDAVLPHDFAVEAAGGCQPGQMARC